MKLNNLRINTRLFAAFSICLGFLFLVAVVSLAAFSQFNDSVEQVVERETTTLDAALTMQVYVRANSRRIMELAIAGTPEQQKHVESRILANRKQSDEARAILERLADEPEELTRLEQLKKSERAMYDAFDKVAVAARKGERQQAIDLVNGDVTRLISVLTKGLEEAAAAQKKRLSRTREEVKALYVSRRNLVMGLSLVALFIAALMAWAVARSITRPLAEAVKGAQAVAAGDLSTRYVADGRDELADLGRQLASMQSRLQTVIDEQMRMVERHEAGFVSHRIDEGRFPGVYAELVRKVNDLAALHIDINRKVISTVSEYSVGNLAPDMQPLPEELAEVSAAVSGIKGQLRAINGEILKLSTAASMGDFSVRGDEARFQYAFREMVAGLNALMNVADSGLTEIARVLNRIAAGDLTERITADFHGTFAQLRDDVNRTVDQLSVIVTQINEASVSIGEASTQIAAGNTDLSARTEEQASSLEETASSMEELMGAVKQNAESAKQANQLALSASDVASKGGEVVGQVVQTMGSISDSARKIEDIISVIDGIAFQTNILALNAAVEAARAGEQGKGFAVVASEVRSLAQRSSAAAKEIKDLIGDSVDKVESGSRLVNEAGMTMDEVVRSVKRVNDIISEITAASMEQSSGIEQVNQAVVQMDQTTQQNAALVEEAAAAAEAMEEQSRGLIQAVSAFKLNQEMERARPARPQLVAVDGPTPAASTSKKRTESPRKTEQVVEFPARVSSMQVGNGAWKEV